MWKLPSAVFLLAALSGASETNPHLRSSIAVSSNEPALRVESAASAVTSDSDVVARSVEARLEALETEQRARFEALEMKRAQDLETIETLKTELETLKTKHAVLQRCIEVEEVSGGDATKLHVKSECELNVHGSHTTHGHHAIRGGNLFVSNGLGSSKCSSTPSSIDEDGDDATVKCSGTGNIIVGHQRDDALSVVLAMWPRALMPLPLPGSSHTVSGAGAIALGGFHGRAFGDNSVVSGGNVNTAEGSYSSVSGGNFNIAEGYSSSISGGSSNTASGFGSSVSGGNENIAEGHSSSVLGGQSRTADSEFQSVPAV
ncbi:hypothetical protein THAOC_33970 [Thalassiosira oceanica]|uniref:Uncharacterized protein n=1 Tax=Thalassiosira oceanica TaxID=159749 RepID=K0R5Y5_THAOC|nr:hypothetical protein THAOC_33970 [Thalassiosira oceanica]|eukprot:EJK47319.1 hypothetical protein THAOC_33970 [Thalassiosira oceanica]